MNRWEKLRRVPAPAIVPRFGPLSGMRVLTTGDYIAMPKAATMLAEFGAEVICLERPGGGNCFRDFTPYIKTEDGKRVGSSWAAMSRNRLSVCLDVNFKKNEAALEVFYSLIKNCDVWLESLVWLEKLGLNDKALLEINPALIIAHVSGYGKPEFGGDPAVCGKPAFDIIAQAASGWMIQNGEPDGAPMCGHPGLSDFATSYNCVMGVLMAYISRMTTGVGQVVDAAMFESQALFIQDYITAWADAGVMKPRNGSKEVNFQPFDIFLAADGKYVALGGFGPKTFHCAIEALSLDPEKYPYELTANGAEAVNSPLGKEFDAYLRQWVAARPSSEVVRHMDHHQVPAQTVVDAEDIIHDPHWIGRGDIVRYRDETLGREVTALGVIPKLSETPGQIWRGAPTAGQDTDLVLQTLCGYSQEELRDLRGAGVIS